MPVQEIELHDSEIDRITVENGTAFVHFSSAYVHQFDDLAGREPHTGWSQECNLAITGATIVSSFSDATPEGHWLMDGSLEIGSTRFDNIVPLPFETAVGDVQFCAESRLGERLLIIGTSARWEMLGQPSFVEVVPSDLTR